MEGRTLVLGGKQVGIPLSIKGSPFISLGGEKKTPVFINCVCLKGSDQRRASFQAVGGVHLHMDMLFINVLLFIKAGSPRPSAAQQGVAPARLLPGESCLPRHRSARAPVGRRKGAVRRGAGRGGWHAGPGEPR